MYLRGDFDGSTSSLLKGFIGVEVLDVSSEFLQFIYTNSIEHFHET